MASQDSAAPATPRHGTSAGPAPFFRPRRLTHSNIFVGNLDRSMAFYRNVVGLEEAWRRANISAGFLNNGNTHHDIGMVDVDNPQFKDKQPGLFHLAFELENQVDLRDGYVRGVAEGMPIKFSYDHEISQSVYTPDPDGNMVEIYADTDWRWWEDRYLNRPANQMPNRGWKPGDTEPSTAINYDPHPTFKRVEEAVFHPLRITHIVMVMERFEEGFDYYAGQVGLVPVLGGRNDRFASLAGTCGERSLSLFRATDGRVPGFHHQGYLCRDEEDLERSIARARKQGIAVEVDLDHASRRTVMVRDPDGLRVQFYVDRRPLRDVAAIDTETLLYLV